jgi:hypothetical protein
MAGIDDLPADPPNPADPPDPPQPRRSHRVTCEGCECVLTQQGEIIALGAKFKANRKLQDRIDELTDELAVTTRALTTARQEIERLSKPVERKRFLV